MSGLIFNANEAFEIAKRIEHNGVIFYTKAAEIVQDQSSKDLMKELAEMEVVHEKVFASMQDSLKGDEKAETMYDPHDDAYQFLKGMADKYVFNPSTDPSGVLKPGAEAKDILEFAIQREKDSIIFYEGIKVMVPEKFGRVRLDEIIAQEMGHVIILTKQLSKVS